MANADLIVTYDTAVWIQFQLALYVTHPEMFPVGTDVIVATAGGASLLASDGSGANALALTNAQINTLISNGKPAGYVAATKLLAANAPIYQYLQRDVRGIIQAGKQTRDAYQDGLSNPLTPLV